MLEALLRELEEPGNGRVFGLSLDENDFIWRADPDAIIASRNRGFQVNVSASSWLAGQAPVQGVTAEAFRNGDSGLAIRTSTGAFDSIVLTAASCRTPVCIVNSR